MEVKDIIEIFAIIISPIVAVGTTLWYQNRKEKRDAKKKLFLNLIAHRGIVPRTKEFLDSLNSINVVFYADNHVLDAWNKYYDSLIGFPFDQQSNAHIFLDLLSTIGDNLGYGKLKQTHFDRFYSPQSSANQQQMLNEIHEELLRVLKNSESYGDKRKVIEVKSS